MNSEENKSYVNALWDNSIIPALIEYIRIPNKSPLFDKDWQDHGHMDKAADLIAGWCRTHAVPHMQLEIVRIENRTPIILMDIPGNLEETVLLYGHFDKQPEMSGWDADLGPWHPVLRGEKLYGRGAADDGYAVFASLAAIKSLQEQQLPHPRCLILIESCEESGSFDLPFYMDLLEDRIGNPRLVICLDSGCGNYEQMWLTNSLRGLVGGVLKIEVLTQGVHSGSGSGIVPSCSRILRQLLQRIENDMTGEVLLNELHTDIPTERVKQAVEAAKVLGNFIFTEFPFQKEVQPESGSLTDLLLNRTWKPALSITGCDGLPPLTQAGNVTLPSLAVKLSMRIPPTCHPEHAAQALKMALEKNPPYQAKVHFEIEDKSPGWNAPREEPWLLEAVNNASQLYFGKDAVHMGEGGSIPFMGMLGKKFPQAQFLITGVLGPHANAHGPNEFLHIPTGKKLTCAIAHVMVDFFNHLQNV